MILNYRERLRKVKKPLLFLCLLIIICLGSYFRWLEIFELITYDWRLRLRPQQTTSADIAIIEIANDSLNQLGRWPFDRKHHAQLIRVLSEYGARAICFDIIFDYPSSSDEELILATSDSGRIYYPFGRKVGLIRGLKQAARGYGHINIAPDIDGKRRYIQPFIKTGQELIPQLSLAVASDYLSKRPQEFILPLDDQQRLIINYAGSWTETFKHYSYVDILVSYEQLKSGKVARLNLSELRNMVCFVGLTAVGTTDIAPTPLQTVYPMLGVNANIFNSIITANYLVRLGRSINLLILIFLLGIAAWLYRRNRGSFKWVFWLVVLWGGLFFLAGSLFVRYGLWIDLAYPATTLFIGAFCLLFFSYLNERQKHLLLEHDLEIAARLQQGFLSRSAVLKRDGIQIAAQLQPSRYIGGDFYDIIKLDNALSVILIGDVTGKGVPASLYMALSISIFRTYIKLHRQPAKILESVNQELKQRYPPGIFATAILLMLDSQGKGCFANAGHTAMEFKSKDGVVGLEAGTGMPLGIIKDGEYKQSEINLASQDMLVLYTDGISEAKNKEGEEFGSQRLRKLIKENDFLPPAVLAERILKGVSDYLQPLASDDDLTVVVIKRG